MTCSQCRHWIRYGGPDSGRYLGRCVVDDNPDFVRTVEEEVACARFEPETAADIDYKRSRYATRKIIYLAWCAVMKRKALIELAGGIELPLPPPTKGAA
jgi:hypothetical protein